MFASIKRWCMFPRLFTTVSIKNGCVSREWSQDVAVVTFYRSHARPENGVVMEKSFVCIRKILVCEILSAC